MKKSYNMSQYQPLPAILTPLGPGLIGFVGFVEFIGFVELVGFVDCTGTL